MLDGLVFDELVTVDASGKRDVPDLAEVVPTLANGGISRDGLTITYKLRRGVRWQDGVPFTSRDVAFTWRAVMNPANNVKSQHGYALVRSVETPDDRTVVFRMKRRFSPAIDTIFGESDTPYRILPEHLLGKLHDVNAIPFNAEPIGTGPYRLKEWVRDDHLTFVPNPNYFRGKPKLSSILVKLIPDENSEISALRTHDVDWQFEASPNEYRELQTIPDTTLVLQNNNEYERIQINTRRPPLDDPRVRRALAYATDRRKLVDTLTTGSAVVADQDLPPFMWAHARGVRTYPYDPAKASALLAAAGFVPGRDGVLERDGRPLALELVTNANSVTRRSAAVLVQAMYRRVGVAVVLHTYLPSMLFATLGQGGILQNGKYDISWTGWIAGADPDDSSTFSCAAQPPGGNNETHYCKPAMDAAQTSALTHYDRPTRARDYARIETLLGEDQPEIPIWWPRMIQPINPDFRNFTPNPVTESWNAYQWDI